MAKDGAELVERAKREVAKLHAETGANVQRDIAPYVANYGKGPGDTSLETVTKGKKTEPLKATVPEEKKTSADKMWDRRSEPEKMSETTRAKQEKDKAKKQHEDYFKALGAKRKELSGTGTPNIIQNNPYGYNADLTKEIQGMERQERVLRARAEQAEQDYIDAFNKEKFEEDMAIITGLPEEQRLALERYSQSKYMTSDIYDHDIIDEMREKYGQERLDSLEGTLSLQRNEQHAKDIEEKAAAFVEKQGGRGTVANLASVPVAAYSGLMRTSAQLGEAMIGTRGYIGMDPYVGAAGDAFIGGVRGQTSENIAKTLGDGFVGNAANIGYQAVMSYLDNAARVTLGGGSSIIGATLAGTSAFSQTVAEASAKGADFAEAAALGTVSAFIEYGTEKMNLDSLIGIAGGEAGESIIRNIIKNAGVEIAEEEISLIANVFAEAAILQEKGSFNQSVNKYILEGKSPEEARRLASDEIIAEALNTALVTGFSGALGGYTASLYDKNKGTSTLNTTPKTAEELKQQALDKVKAIDKKNQTPAAEPEQMQQEQKTAPVEPAATVTENATTDKTEAVTPEQQKENVRKAIGEAMFAKGAEMAGRDVQQEAQRQETVQKPQTEAQQSAQTETEPQAQPETLGMQNEPSGDIAQSKTYTNTGENSADEDIRGAYKQTMEENPQAADYEVKHNKDTMATAQERTQTVEQARVEADYLNNKDPKTWTAEDNVTAELVIKKMMQDGGENSAQVIADTARQRAKANINAGQVIQSNKIIGTMRAAQSTETAVDSFVKSIESMSEGETTYQKRKDGKDFETWKRDIEVEVTKIGQAIDKVEDGDAGSMREIIRQIANRRNTTAMFGMSQNMTATANRILNKLEFEDLKKIANTQVAAMADDYRKRTKTEIAISARKQAMLTSLQTFARNITGNSAGGLGDALSDSTSGQMADILLSKFTGKRTTGNDLTRAKAYIKGAKDATSFASLCVELNIPIETSVDASFEAATGDGGKGKYIGRTFTAASGNPVMRAMYAYQKYMSYALEVSDKIFEGGTNAAVAESLDKLKNSGLSDEDASSLSDYTTLRRTFKDATWEDINKKGETVTKGSGVSRFASDVKNVGKGTTLGNVWNAIAEYKVPFSSTGSNIAQTGIDYTTGVVRGAYQIASIIKDAKAGKNIPVERQRHAVSVFGRGMTGVGAIAAFAAAASMGALRVSNDEDRDKEALAQAEGRSGAQFNWDAFARGLNGEDAKWKSDDAISSVDFLEPFNTQMYLGSELAEYEKIRGEDDPWYNGALKYGEATIKSVFNSIMDSPMFTGLADSAEDIKDVIDAAQSGEDGAIGEALTDVFARNAGDAVSSYIPQVVRQAAQAKDGFYRDTRGNTPLETAVNKVKSAIPGIAETLPKKYSGLGEEQKRNGAFDTFIDPTDTKRFQENEITTYLDQLSKRTGDDTIYPDRQAPMKINVNGKEIPLDGGAREKYQKTYGDKVTSYYAEMIKNVDFEKLPDDLKSEVMNNAKKYAVDFAKSSVSEWKETPTGTDEANVNALIAKSVSNSIKKQFDKIKTDWDYGYDDTETRTAMETAFQNYKNLSHAARKNVLEAAEGDAALYIQARNQGISQDKFVGVVKSMEILKDKLNDESLNQSQKIDVVKKGKLTDSEKVIAGKLYVSDAQDKNIDEVQQLTRELKADGKKTPNKGTFDLYAELYEDHQNYTKGTGKKNRTTKYWEQKYGIDAKTADQYYDLFK